MRSSLLMKSSLVLAFCLCNLSAIAQQERPPLEFVDSGPMKLQADRDNKVQVLNNRATNMVLTVQLIDGSTTGDSLLSSVVEVESEAMQLPSAGGGTIVLRIKPNHPLKPGSSLAGYLVVSEGGSGTVLRRPVSFEVPDTSAEDKPGALKSLTPGIASTVYFWPLFESGIVKPSALPVPVPLSSTETPDAIKSSLDGKSVAQVVMPTGEMALVSYEGVTTNLPGGTSGVLLGFTGGGVVGQYDGESSAIKAPDDKPLKLRVIFKHHWVYAAGMILLGIGLYYLMQGYLNVLRKVLDLRGQHAHLEDAFSRAEEHFKEAAKGKPYSNESIRPDFQSRSKDLLKTIKGLKKEYRFKIDESGTTYKEIVDELSKLNSVVKEWSLFADTKLNPLSEALKACQPGFAIRPSDLSITDPVPEIAVEAAAMLEASPGLMSIDQFEKRKAKVAELLPAVSGWRALNSRVAMLVDRYEEFIKGPDFKKLNLIQQATLNSNMEQALVIWRKLWTRPVADIDIKTLNQSVFNLEDSLAILSGIAAGLPGAAGAAEEAYRGSLSEGEDSPTERIAHIGRQQLAWDLFYLALVIAVATYGGLKTLYFGHPFGAVQDYFEAFVAGFSTKPLIDMAALAINKFTSRGA